jgi:conjugative transfer signal peptidase TraF
MNADAVTTAARARSPVTAGAVLRSVATTTLAAAAAAGVAALVASHLVWNRTESVPRGLYWLSDASARSPHVGELVAFPVPGSVAALVAERRYLPRGVTLLLKPVAAAAGDEVCAEDAALRINREVFGPVPVADSLGRPLPHLEGCAVVPHGALFVASHHARSFDSRVFGFIDTAALRGRARPLWTY